MPVRLLSLSSALASMSGLGLCVVSQKARHSLGSGFGFLAGSSLSCEASSEAHSSSAASAASTSTGHEPADRDGSSMWSSWERRIGSFSAGSGFVMKDTVQVTRIDDPAIEGITLYLTQMKRPVTDRIRTGDLFTDPSDASLTVVKTTPHVKFRKPIVLTEEGEEVFSKSRNLFFKSTRVRRVYDKERKVLIYVSYSERLQTDMTQTNSRFRTSTAAVALGT
ncbi:hypothetical protein PPROV_000799100 [Pycnococcus provasolii]|uniref:Uncharacterized protein n=1 Tax=Pycnococcus provasolii TaxID=41880 RepID=A0A830HQ24_9CHLO|nr:hypothetical protein PPROV_000799100 [Pycnococcus provasolii]|mmetsp:Transcript_10396/g.27942  ORF Transcript_10396/g.27942 Transcript_10396/m.27942 type:complete len:222 (-) Transcript_10396:66-731(-)